MSLTSLLGLLAVGAIVSEVLFRTGRAPVFRFLALAALVALIGLALLLALHL